MNSRMKTHGVYGYGDHRPPGVFHGRHRAGFVAQFHDDTTVDIAQNVGLGYTHRLRQANA